MDLNGFIHVVGHGDFLLSEVKIFPRSTKVHYRDVSPGISKIKVDVYFQKVAKSSNDCEMSNMLQVDRTKQPSVEDDEEMESETVSQLDVDPLSGTCISDIHQIYSISASSTSSNVCFMQCSFTRRRFSRACPKVLQNIRQPGSLTTTKKNCPTGMRNWSRKNPRTKCKLMMRALRKFWTSIHKQDLWTRTKNPSRNMKRYEPEESDRSQQCDVFGSN